MPRVFDRIHNGVITKLEEKGGLAAKLFHWGYSIKAKKLRKNVRQDKVWAPALCALTTTAPWQGSRCK